MFRTFQSVFLARVPSTRCYAQLVVDTREAASHSTLRPTLVQHSYFLPRNSRGSLPVYTDIRNSGTRRLVLVRNVEGDVNRLAKDLADTLFAQGSHEASRIQIRISNSRHLIISGGRWKTHVIEWLQEKVPAKPVCLKHECLAAATNPLASESDAFLACLVEALGLSTVV